MSRIYDALQQTEKEKGQSGLAVFPAFADLANEAPLQDPEFKAAKAVKFNTPRDSRLVAFSEPQSLGAEKFRVLATRLDHLRRQKEIKSIQVTSSVINEGKTLVAANLAVTFAQRTRSRVLLLEGDLHRPSLGRLLGVSEAKGLSHWWSEQLDIGHFLCQVDGMPLWFLSAGTVYQQPSQILQSSRFAEAFNWLTQHFDWIVVDSTPMLPIADVNLWSRLVDGSLLVVREGVAPREAVKRGMQALDNPKFVGAVINGASKADKGYYAGGYYGASNEMSKS